MPKVYVVTRNASCYSDHDFSTMCVELDDFGKACRQVALHMFAHADPKFYCKSNRFHDYGRQRLDDHWRRYSGTSIYQIECWQPGDDKPEEVWHVNFDRWFKHRIIDENMSDDKTLREWERLTGNTDAMDEYLDTELSAKIEALSEEDERTWVSEHGFS